MLVHLLAQRFVALLLYYIPYHRTWYMLSPETAASQASNHLPLPGNKTSHQRQTLDVPGASQARERACCHSALPGPGTLPPLRTLSPRSSRRLAAEHCPRCVSFFRRYRRIDKPQRQTLLAARAFKRPRLAGTARANEQRPRNRTHSRTA